MNIVSECRCFGGRQMTLEHQSASTGTTMRVAVFLPPKADTLGDDDPWLDSGLRPELLEAAFQASGQEGEIRRHAGYDHSYFFVGKFFEDHIRHHARELGA